MAYTYIHCKLALMLAIAIWAPVLSQPRALGLYGLTATLVTDE